MDAAELLLMQFLAWVADRPRTHADVMEAWRSSCPRFPVWEDSVIEWLVAVSGDGRAVTLTPKGQARLQQGSHVGSGRSTLVSAGADRG